jgi:hypothetical protein
MNARILIFAFWLAGISGLVVSRVSAKYEVSAGISIQSTADFYQPLSASGQWVQIGGYGQCWHPAVTLEWRPYCNGYWEWTDCGWYWVSDDPWAWACYHYGTWVADPTYGWVWVPGVEWAPAWVTWRTGGGYIGWAPCGPPGVVVVSTSYVFVEGQHFNDHLRSDTVIVNNATIANRTTEIKNVTREQRQVGGHSQTVIVNNGPGLAAVEKATGRKFQPTPVQQVDRSTARSIPEQLKSTPAQPNNRQPQTPLNYRNSGNPAVVPQSPNDRTIQPRPNDLPANVPAPDERPVPQQPQEQKIRPAPPERTSPVPPNNEVPVNRGQQVPPVSKQVVPPTQAPQHPVPPVQGPPHPMPVAPKNNPPEQKPPPPPPQEHSPNNSNGQ